MGNFKKIGTNLEQYTLKIVKILRTASLGSNFTGSYKKHVPQQEEGNHYSVIKGVLYRSGDASCFFIFRESYFLPNDQQNKTFLNTFSKRSP